MGWGAVYVGFVAVCLLRGEIGEGVGGLHACDQEQGEMGEMRLIC